MMRTWLGASAILLLLASSAVLAVPQRQETGLYFIGAVGDVTVVCVPTEGSAIPADVRAGIGGVCFRPRPMDFNVQAEIQDDLNLPTGGALSFRNASNAVIESHEFCNISGIFGIPAGTARIVVFLNDPLFNMVICGVATTSLHGTVTATFNG